MKFLASIALFASAIAAAAIPRDVTSSFSYLKTAKSLNPAHNDLYLYIYNTTAQETYAAFSPDINAANSGLISNGYLVFPLLHGLSFGAWVDTLPGGSMWYSCLMYAKNVHLTTLFFVIGGYSPVFLETYTNRTTPGFSVDPYTEDNELSFAGGGVIGFLGKSCW